MSWARLDDRYPRHPKVQAAGAMGMCLDVAGICYAADHASDGFVPDVALPTLLAFANRRQHETAAAKLVTVGRWYRDDKAHGYWIHDYLKYNPSAAERKQAAELTESRRSADRERKRRERGRRPPVPETSERTVPGRPRTVQTTPNPPQLTAKGRQSVAPVPADTSPPSVGQAADDDVPQPPNPALASANGSRCRHGNDPATCGVCSPAVGVPPTSRPSASLRQARPAPDPEPDS